MPVKYEILNDGHRIHAVASGTVAGEEFADYQASHPEDAGIVEPVSEPFEVATGALSALSVEDINAALKHRGECEKSKLRHKCAIVVDPADGKG
jgi:hypothetical protein